MMIEDFDDEFNSLNSTPPLQLNYAIMQVKWSYDKKNWKVSREEKVWIDSLKSILYIDFPKVKKLSLGLSKENSKKITAVKSSNNDVYCFNLSKLIDSIKPYSEQCYDNELFYTYITDSVCGSVIIFKKIYAIISINKFSVFYDSNHCKMYVDLDYFGEGDMYSKVYEYELPKKIILENQNLLKKGRNDLPSLSKSKTYLFELHEDEVFYDCDFKVGWIYDF